MVAVTISAGGKTIATTSEDMIRAAALVRASAHARAPAREGRRPASASQTKEGQMAEADTSSIAAQELRLFVERVERLNEEKKGLNDDIAEVFGEMKGRGYDTKIVKKVIQIRAKKKGEHEEESMVLETYLSALGMI